MTRDDWIDGIEGFLTVFAASFTAAVVNTSGSYMAPNKWALLAGVIGGLLAAVRKIQAHRAEPPR